MQKENYPSKIAKHWDEMLEDVFPYKTDIPSFQEIFKDNNVKSVLDVGCGTGKHLRRLAKLGYQCTGIDNNPNMLEVARKKVKEEGLHIEFLEGDMRDFSVEKKFDAAISMYTINLPDTEENKKVFRCIHDALKDDGIFLFDVINAEGVPGLLPGPEASPGEGMPLGSEVPPIGEKPSGAEMLPPPPPTFFNMEVLVDREGLKIVRLNNFLLKGAVQSWNPVYLIEEDGIVTIEIQNSEVQMFFMDEIEKMLQECGFKIESVISRYIQILKNELIYARKQNAL